MPQLNPQKAAQVKKADTTSPFEAIAEGHYKFKLTKVESGKSKAGNAMWTWHFSQVDGKKKLKEFTTLDEDNMWKLATLFEAFGVDPSVSTDSLLGQSIVLHIGVELNEWKGKTTKRNYIVGYPDQNASLGSFEAGDGDEDEAAEPKPAPKAAAKKPAAKKTKATDESPDF